MDDRIERNVIIARSGCYDYGKEELACLNLTRDSVPEQHKDRDTFTVYTPANVLVAAKDLFAKLPIVIEHPVRHGNVVTPKNFGELAKGWSGDTVEIVPVEGTQEIGLGSTVNLLGIDALIYYECNVRDVSPGYWALYRWEDGTSPDGKEYQIIKYEIKEVNHLAFTQKGRGGPEISMDSANLASLHYYSNRITCDSAQPTFKEMLRDIEENRLTYDSEELASGVDALLSVVNSMPDCKEKLTLTRIVQDFYDVKRFTGDSSFSLAAKTVLELYEELDKKIMEDSMGLFGKKPTTDAAPPPEPEKKPDEAPAAEEPAADTAPPANVPTEPEAPAAAPGVAPVGPEAADPAAAVAPVAAAAMEVAAMPDDVSSLSDDQLRAFLNGVVKFLKSIAPGEAQEPEHQETAPAEPVTDSVTPEGEGIPSMDSGVDLGKEDKVMTSDSIFRVSMGDSAKPAKSFEDFNKELFGKKGAK